MPRGYATYTNEDLAKAVKESFSYANVLRLLGIKQAGGSQSHIRLKIQRLGYDSTHFTGVAHQKGRPCNNGTRLKPEDIFVVRPPGSFKQKSHILRRALLESGVPEMCNECNLGPLWNGKFLQLEVDHINENWLDNRKENLQFLCSNCHTQKSN